MSQRIFKSIFFMAVLSFVVVPQAKAHDIWAMAENPAVNKPLVAILGYGHDFPKGEEIAADRVSIFNPLEVVDSQGNKLAMKPGAKNFIAVTEKPVPEGSYLVLTGYKPTFWSSTPQGSVMKSKKEAPGATSCERYSRSAKGVVNVGAAADDFVTKPVGFQLEIVPLVNPGKVKVGGDLPLQVLRDGKPLARAEIKGALAGNKHQGAGNRDFYAITDRDGKATMSPIKEGFWNLSVEVRSGFADTSVCDEEAGDSTLSFVIAN
jgi:uncharacterized GH25 family protein